MVALMKFFELGAGKFRNEWNELSEKDKNELKAGIADGTLTY